MQNSSKSQPKQTLGQRKSKVQSRNKAQLSRRQPRLLAEQSSDEKYRRLFEMAQDGILLLDARTGVISDANPIIEEMFGYTPAELIGNKLWETGPFKNVSASQAIFLKLQKKSYFRYEDLPLETKDGQRRNVEFVSNVYPVGRRKVIQCNIRDITERRQAENALVESMRRYQDLFDNAGLGIFQTSADGRIITVNPEFASMLGYKSPEDLLSVLTNAADVFADPQRRAEIIHLKAENPGMLRFENLYRRKDGSTFFGSLTLRQVAGQDGQALYEGLVEDISQRKQAEENVNLSEARYRSLVETQADVISRSDLSGNLLFVSDSYCSTFRVLREQVLGTQYRLTVFPEDRPVVLEMQEAIKQPPFRKYIEIRNVTPDGVRWFGWDNSAVRNEQGAIIEFQGVGRDITERKRAEDALEKVERTYRLAITQAGIVPYQRYYQDEKFTILGNGFKSLTGYNPEEMTTQLFNSRLREIKSFGEFKTLSREERARLARKGEVKEWREDYLFERKDGKKIWLAHHSLPMYGDNGDVVGSLGILSDITERKQAEEALRESESLLRESQVSAGMGSYVLDIPGGFWKSTDILDQVFGIDAAYERSVDGWAALTHPDDQSMMVDYFNNEVLGQGRPFNKEYRIIRPSDQAERWVHGFGKLECDALGQPVKMHGTIQDITERKQAEDALRTSEEKFRKAFFISPDAININRLQDGMYIAINKGFTQIIGYTEAECIGKTSLELNIWADPADRERLVDSLRNNGEVTNLDAHFCAKDGSIRYGLMSASVLELDNIPHILSITRDITERKRAEIVLAQQAEELRRRNDELARLYRASGSLISGASLSLQDLAQSIVSVVQQEFGQANCSLLAVSRDSNELLRLAAAGPYTGQVKSKRLTLDGLGLVPQAIRTGETINQGNVRLAPEYVSNWEAAQSEMAIPLKIGKHVVGVIDVQSSEPQAFSPDDERLMSIFAERAALVLEHSRLNTQTEKHMQQLLALRTIDMAISSSFDLSMTLGVLLDQIIRLLGIHAVDILAFNTPTQTFKFSCERGFRSHTLQHMQIKFGAGYAWSLVRERQMIVVPDIRAVPDGLQRIPDLSGEQFVTYIGMPVLAKGQVKGVLEVFQRETLVLEPEGYAFLEMLAGQVAIAIDNSELFEHLQSSNAELGMAYDSTLEGWANALELRDKETEGHTRRVAELSTRLAQTMGVRENDILQIYRGALLHDIGKMGVPDSIVLKPGPLTEDEWVIMHKHPQYAADMLSPIAYLRQALDIPYCHHERWDGTGYPRGLKGAQIPMSARIFAIVDVWDAITSDRPYRKAWQKEIAIQYIQEQSGKHFDPEVVKAFLSPSFKREYG
jgi:PAS domain S-box-containing protein